MGRNGWHCWLLSLLSVSARGAGGWRPRSCWVSMDTITQRLREPRASLCACGPPLFTRCLAVPTAGPRPEPGRGSSHYIAILRNSLPLLLTR